MTTNDAVNHPSHYTSGKIEVIDFIADQGLDFALGNVVKYISRAGKKHEQGVFNGFKEIEDLEKAEFYLKYKIKQLKESYSFAEDQENNVSANKNNISLAKS